MRKTSSHKQAGMEGRKRRQLHQLVWAGGHVADLGLVPPQTWTVTGAHWRSHFCKGGYISGLFKGGKSSGLFLIFLFWSEAPSSLKKIKILYEGYKNSDI